MDSIKDSLRKLAEDSGKSYLESLYEIEDALEQLISEEMDGEWELDDET